MHYLCFYFCRVTGNEEKIQLQEFLSAMLECRFSHIPLETLTHDYFLQQSSGFTDYFDCYNSTRGFTKQTCFEDVYPLCGKTAEDSVNRSCPLLSRAAKSLTSTVIQNTDIESASKQIKMALVSEGITITEKIQELIKPFVERELCFPKVWKVIRQCLGLAVNRCRSSPMRVLEINRMKMEDMDFVIQAFPNVHYFYYTRDPRGISLSRAMESYRRVEVNDTRAITEARYLCPRMLRDVVEFRHLKRKYPGLIHHVRYEDFVTNPIMKSVEVYDHLGRNAPANWASFVAKNMHAKEKRKYQVIDAKETATNWMRDIPKVDLREMDHMCGEVLDSLGYPRYSSIN